MPRLQVQLSLDLYNLTSFLCPFEFRDYENGFILAGLWVHHQPCPCPEWVHHDIIEANRIPGSNKWHRICFSYCTVSPLRVKMCLFCQAPQVLIQCLEQKGSANVNFQIQRKKRCNSIYSKNYFALGILLNQVQLN